ncbi:MAG: nickel-dependent hydrogenase large subunit [Desulfobacterales bacterium]|nr:nickel-dependent hydrogenase large subunit [Desulfobacterales bacterium]
MGPCEEALIGTPVADPEAAARDPAHDPLLRPVHRLRGARDRPGFQRSL